MRISIVLIPATIQHREGKKGGESPSSDLKLKTRLIEN
jgi:hypothetical protein